MAWYLSQDHFATKIKILNKQTKFHVILSISWKWIHSKFIIFTISETWFMRIFRHHSTTVKLSHHALFIWKKLFYADFKKRRRSNDNIYIYIYIYIFHDSMAFIIKIGTQWLESSCIIPNKSLYAMSPEIMLFLLKV